jgi:hypothetical protein
MARPRPSARKFDQKKGVRRLARERIGTVPASRVIVPKTRRRKPKHPKSPVDLEEAQ